MSQRKIAGVLGVHPTTVGDDLRNAGNPTDSQGEDEKNAGNPTEQPKPRSVSIPANKPAVEIASKIIKAISSWQESDAGHAKRPCHHW